MLVPATFCLRRRAVCLIFERPESGSAVEVVAEGGSEVGGVAMVVDDGMGVVGEVIT